MTLDEMVEAVDGIETGGGGITPTGNIDITQAGVTDVTNYATATVPSADPLVVANTWYGTEGGVRKFYIEPAVLFEDEGDPVGDAGWLGENTYGETRSYNALASGTSVTPTESSQTIGGANTMMAGAVTVDAIPLANVHSGENTGYYTSGGERWWNNNVYIYSDTNGYAPVSPGGTTVYGKDYHAVPSNTSITPSRSAQTVGGADYMMEGAVTVNPIPNEYIVPPGNLPITANGNNIDVAQYATVSVNVPTGGTTKNTQVVQGTTRTTSSTLTAVGAEMTVSKTGTYDIYWSAFRSTTSASYTYGTQLYINGTAYGSENSTWSNHVQNNHLTNVSLTANQKLRVYGRNSRGSSYYIYAPTLVIVEA
jgi:hypothetical protein